MNTRQGAVAPGRNCVRLRPEASCCTNSQVSLRSGRIAGSEALLRWKHPPVKGMVPPSQFIPVAEETGF
ncbi:MAG: EAL domain-containing protein [Rhodoferax sp.]|nr:EAL domain-containing protein [Rhodoferax sp.]